MDAKPITIKIRSNGGNLIMTIPAAISRETGIELGDMMTVRATKDGRGLVVKREERE